MGASRAHRYNGRYGATWNLSTLLKRIRNKIGEIRYAGSACVHVCFSSGYVCVDAFIWFEALCVVNGNGDIEIFMFGFKEIFLRYILI